jgi:tetratricopeptide (TPR) repeat protein
MRRTVVLLLGALLAVAGVVAIQRLNQDRQYRGLLADGDTAIAAGQPYLAVEAFSGALAIRADSMVAHYRRGEAYAALGQALQAERDLREARRLAPDAPEPLEALGRLHDARGDHAVAADWYTQAAERLPAAREAARRALAVDDTLAEAHYLLGLVAHDLQHRREAISALEQAVRLRPTLVAARQELAAVYREEGRIEDEAAQLRALVAHDGQLDRHLALARAQLRTGQHAAALATLATAEAASPGDSRVALAVGRVHLSRADQARDPASIAAALAALERALGGTARRSEGLALYGRALHLSGDADGAERLLTDAIRTSPVAPAAFGYLADAAESLSHHLVARDALLSLDALEGNTAPAPIRQARARRIGALSLAGEDAATAAQYLSLAHAAGDHSADTTILLVRALWAAGRRDEAKATLAAALAQTASNADLRRLERTLR